MERKWTPAQKSAIDTRDCNVLVSAAAGSGKTAVLVERIISMITDPDKNIDIDRLVVVTFTKAAAAQMIMERDYGKLVGIKNGEIVRIPLEEVAGKLKTVDPNASIIKEAKAVGISFGD